MERPVEEIADHGRGLLVADGPGERLPLAGEIVHEVAAPVLVVLALGDLDATSPVEIVQAGVPFLASQSVGMNVLSLDEQHVVVQDIQVPLIRDLERHGFTPIPVRWRHGRSLGGGFHCVTLDIRRHSTADFKL